jgi:uncharacterized membrane-anchored protein
MDNTKPQWRWLGVALLFLGILADRLAVRFDAATLPLALLSLAALVGGIAVLISATVAAQPVTRRRRTLWIGIGLAVGGVVLAFGIGCLM